ncbi:uncharacterized protein [Spinacia oleracea]|uniref:RNase H type-1 domain-containing protein n=1 Tax=Spinacia oleracea TaxID=3562 RepID=A0A9R0IPI0_SPIOL|nr:uncharacterized protein LOC110792141 [Spinacia oleracea]
MGFSFPMTDFFKTLDYLRHNQVALRKFITLCWTIWKERNALVFSNTKVSPCRCYYRALNTFKEWELRLRIDDQQLKGSLPSPSSPPTTSQPIIVRWFPPPPGAFKLNFDGSRKDSSAAGGIIIRDSTGKAIIAKSFNFGDSQVYMAEALALHKGIQEAINRGIKDIYIEGDNLLVINSLSGTWKPPWKLQNIIQDNYMPCEELPDVNDFINTENSRVASKEMQVIRDNIASLIWGIE